MPLKQGTETRRSRLIFLLVSNIKKMPLKQGTETKRYCWSTFSTTIKKMPLKQGTETERQQPNGDSPLKIKKMPLKQGTETASSSK